jgi:hypothetical protein
MDLIWGKWERIYFRKQGWTAELPDLPAGQAVRVIDQR